MTRFVNADRDQTFLLPPDMRDWVPKDDLCHFVIEAVERVDMNAFVVNTRGSGSPQYDPRMMLALLIYCYANGIFSSRRIERATYRDVGVRFAAANTHPDHDTIATFRRRNETAFKSAFLEVLLLAKELRLLKVGTVSVDGTKIDANASKHKSVRYDRANVLREKLTADIAELVAKAESADANRDDDPQALPAAIARRETLKAKLDEAVARLEAEAAADAAAAQPAYEEKLAKHRDRDGNGRPPKPPSAVPPDKEQTNLTDSDSAIMRKNKHAEYRQAYNGQAAVDADGSMLIVSAHVTNCASDRNELVPALAGIDARVGVPETALADNGYANGEAVAELQRQDIEVLVATGTEARQRPYDYRPPKNTTGPPKEPALPWMKEMKQKMESEAGRAKYKLRQQTVEPVFGIIKEVLGFRRFRLRGLAGVSLEWLLVSLAYNCKRLHRLKCQRHLGAGACYRYFCSQLEPSPTDC
jgi:transposase